MQTRITIKDFFLQLGAMVALYAGAIALINLLFRVINFAFPQIDRYGGYPYYTSSPISLPVATLIVAFPLFLFLSWLIQENFKKDAALRENGLRKFLVYLTLFVAGGVVAGDLITLIYQYLDGQEMTKGFLLKVLSVLVIAGGVFAYYLQDLRNTLTSRSRNIWRTFAVVLVVGSIVAGFAVIGSPATQRAYRHDSERVMHLENMQWQILNYWQTKEVLPSDLTLVTDNFSGWRVPVDPKTDAPYEYEVVDDLTFRLCAAFERSTPELPSGNYARPMMDSIGGIGLKGHSNWDHEAGRQCFERTIDPDFYPPIKR